MRKIFSVLAALGLASLIQAEIQAQTAPSVGLSECGPYTDDPRTVSATLNAASLDVDGSGYALTLGYDDERGSSEIPFDAGLKLISPSSTDGKLKISPDGQFSMSVFANSYFCSTEGVATISPVAASRLFGTTVGPSAESTFIEWTDVEVPFGEAEVGTNTINRNGNQITFDAIADSQYVRYNGNCGNLMLNTLQLGSLDEDLQPEKETLFSPGLG